MKRVGTRTSEYSKAMSTFIVMPHHTNPTGLMFGGVLLSWIDMTAALVAEKDSAMDVATIHVEEVHFQSPIRLGEHVTVEASLVKTGTTSMTIAVEVHSEDAKLAIIKKTTRAVLTFVAVDRNMHPSKVPKLINNQ